MGTSDLPPDDPVLGWLLVPFRLGALVRSVHVGQPLTEVEAGVFLAPHPLQLDQGGVGVLFPLASAVAKDDTLCEQPTQLGEGRGGEGRRV